MNLLLLDLYSSVLCDMQEVYRGSNRKDEKLLEERGGMNTCILSIKRLIIDNIKINALYYFEKLFWYNRYNNKV